MGEVARRLLYGWAYGKTGSMVMCPHLRTTLEEAQRLAEERHVKVRRERWPGTGPQRLEWREQTSPRGFGFGNRFWVLYAERQLDPRRKRPEGYIGEMFRTEYMVNEMWLEENDV